MLLNKKIGFALLTVIEFTILFHNQTVYSADLSPLIIENSKKEAAVSPEELKQKKSLWEKAVNSMSGLRIDWQASLPTTYLVNNGATLGASYKSQSLPSIGDKYSGIDIWKLGVSINPFKLGLKLFTEFFNIDANRNIIYIQQFNHQRESILRNPYDVVAKLPLNSDIFFKEEFNSDYQKNMPLFKKGDFISFSAPLTIRLSDESQITQVLVNNTKAILGAGIYEIGKFEVQVFRISDSHIRVKLIASDETNLYFKVAEQLMTISRWQRVIFKFLFGSNLIEAPWDNKKIITYYYDYLINIKTNEGQKLYNNIFGHRMKFFSLDRIKEDVRLGSPFRSLENKVSDLGLDINEIDQVLKKEEAKPLLEKSVYNLLNANAETILKQNGIKINLFKVLQFNLSDGYSVTDITFSAFNKNASKASYRVDQLSKDVNYLLGLQTGASLKLKTSFVGKLVNNVITNVLGLFYSRERQASSISPENFEKLKMRISHLMPQAIKNALPLPIPKENSDIDNLFLSQEIIFNARLFNLNHKLTAEKISKVLEIIFKSGIELESKPQGSVASLGQNDNQNDQYMIALNNKDYMKAYLFEYQTLPTELSNLFSGQYSPDEIRKKYILLNEQNPVLTEISALLFLNSIDESELADVVSIKQSFSARGYDGQNVHMYPSSTSQDDRLFVKTFNEIIKQTNFVLNNEFNLRDYFNEDGSIILIEDNVKKAYKQLD